MAVTATKVNGQFQFSGRAINITQTKNKALEPYNCIVHDYGITLELPLTTPRSGTWLSRSGTPGSCATTT